MIVSRSPEQIQREIESSRAQLAVTLDQLVEKTSPKRLAAVGRQRAVDLALERLAERPAARPPDVATRPSRRRPDLPPRP